MANTTEKKIEKIVAYIRVSTKSQGASGLGLGAQQTAIDSFAAQNTATVCRVYTEVESGRKSARPQLAAALSHVKRSRATLVVAKLDRLSRDVAFLSALIASGCDFVCCDNPKANTLTLHILSAVAQAEAEAISTRTKAALAEAKAQGVDLGGSNPKCRNLTQAARQRGAIAGAKARTANAAAAVSDLMPIVEGLRSEGLTLAAIADRLNQEGHTTRRGCAWGQVQVGRLLERAEATAAV